MSNTEARDALKDIFERHGLACAREGDWVLPNSQLPAIRAIWHPREDSGRLDVQLLTEDEVLIEECFAGVGAGSKGLSDALHNFMVNSLHVLLAAFWGQDSPDQVLTEQWQVGESRYIAYVGNIGTRVSEGVTFKIPNDFFPALEGAIKQQSLRGDLHWVRVFFCNVAGQWTFEALLNNEEWPAGIQCLQQLAWEKSAGYYSARNFLVMRKAA